MGNKGGAQAVGPGHPSRPLSKWIRPRTLDICERRTFAGLLRQCNARAVVVAACTYGSGGVYRSSSVAAVSSGRAHRTRDRAEFQHCGEVQPIREDRDFSRNRAYEEIGYTHTFEFEWTDRFAAFERKWALRH